MTNENPLPYLNDAMSEIVKDYTSLINTEVFRAIAQPQIGLGIQLQDFLTSLPNYSANFAQGLLEEKNVPLPYELIIPEGHVDLINTPKKSADIIVEHEEKILNLLRNKCLELYSKRDSLADLYYESLLLLEKKYYLAVQALQKDILDVIRSTRIKGYLAGYFPQSPPEEITTTERPLSKETQRTFKKELEDFGYSDEEISITFMMILPYARTDKLIDAGYDPKYTPNRNGSAHSGKEFYSRYNSLAFCLLTIRLLDFCYNSSSIYISAKDEWNTYEDEYFRDN